MKELPFVVVAAAALGLLPMPAAAAERKAAEVECKPTDEKLVYDCMITVKAKGSGAPIADAEFTVGADMPSMPGAHNVRPVTAEPHGMAGNVSGPASSWRWTGEWALKLDFTKPGRDRLIKKLHFGGMAGKEGSESGMSHGKHKGMGHGVQEGKGN